MTGQETTNITFGTEALDLARKVLGLDASSYTDLEVSSLLGRVAEDGAGRRFDIGRLRFFLSQQGIPLGADTDLRSFQGLMFESIQRAGPENPLRRTMERMDRVMATVGELRQLREEIKLEFAADLSTVQKELKTRRQFLHDIGKLLGERPDDPDLQTSLKTGEYKLRKAERKARRYRGCTVGSISGISTEPSKDRFRLEGGEWEREPINYLIEGPMMTVESPGVEHTMDIKGYAVRSFSRVVLDKVISEGWRVEINQLSPFSFARSLVERGFVECFRFDTIKKDFERYIVANPETGEKMLVVHLLEGQSLRTQIEGSLLHYKTETGESLSPERIKIWRSPQSLQQRFRELLEIHDLRPDTVVFGHQELVREIFERDLQILHEREVEDRNLAATVYRIRQDGRFKTVLSINMAPGLFGDRISAFTEEVLQRGAKSLIFIGTAGGLKGSDLKVGDIVLPETVVPSGGGEVKVINNHAISQVAPALNGYNIKVGGVHVSVASPVEEDSTLIRELEKYNCTVDCEVHHLVEAAQNSGDQNITLGVAVVVTDIPGTSQELNQKGLGIDNHYQQKGLPVTDLGMYLKTVFAGATAIREGPESIQVQGALNPHTGYSKMSTNSGTSFMMEGKWGKLSILFPHSSLTSFLHADYKRALNLFEDTLQRRFGDSNEEIGRLELLKTVIPLLSIIRYTYDIDLEIRHSSRSAMEIRDGLGLNRYQKYLSEVSVGSHHDGLEKLPEVTNKRTLRAFARQAGAKPTVGGKEFLLGCLGFMDMVETGVTLSDPHSVDYELVALAAINLRYYSLTSEEKTKIRGYIYGHLKKGRLEACEIALFLAEHPDLEEERVKLAEFILKKLPTVKLDLQTVYISMLFKFLGEVEFKATVFPVLEGLDEKVNEVAAKLTNSSYTPPSNYSIESGRTLTPPYDPALALGVLYGAAIGDAVGAPFEFMAKRDIVSVLGENDFDFEVDVSRTDFRLQPGAITDDTMMGLMIAESMVSRGILDPFDIARRYGEEVFEIDTGGKMNPGYSGGMLHTMRRCYLGCHPLLAGRAKANGCGAAMRVFALPLLAGDEEQLIEWAATTAEMTHNSEIGRASAVSMAVAISYLLRLRQEHKYKAILDKDDFLNRVELAAGRYSLEFADYIGLLKELHEVNSGVTLQLLGTSGRAIETVPSAIYCFLHSPDSLRDILRNAVILDGDSDSIASMACALYGAWHGVNGFSSELRRGLLVNERILSLGEKVSRL